MTICLLVRRILVTIIRIDTVIVVIQTPCLLLFALQLKLMKQCLQLLISRPEFAPFHRNLRFSTFVHCDFSHQTQSDQRMCIKYRRNSLSLYLGTYSIFQLISKTLVFVTRLCPTYAVTNKPKRNSACGVL